MITLLNAPFHARYFEQPATNVIADPITKLIEKELYLKIEPARGLFSSRSVQLIGKDAYDKLLNGLSSTFKTDLVFTSLFTTISVTRSLVFDPIVGEVHTLIKFSGGLQREDQLEIHEILSQLTSSQIQQIILHSISAKDFIAIQACIFALQQRGVVTDKFVKTAIMLAALEDQLPILNFLIAYQEKFFCLNSAFYHMLLSLLINSNQLDSFGLVLEKTVHSQCLSQERLFSIAFNLVHDESKVPFLEKIKQLEAFRACFSDLGDWRKLVINEQDSAILKIILPMIFERGEDLNQFLDPILSEAIIQSNVKIISLVFSYPGLAAGLSELLIAKLIYLALHCKVNQLAILIFSYYESFASRDFFDKLFSCALSSKDPLLKSIIDYYEPQLSSEALVAGLAVMIESERLEEASRLTQMLLARNILDSSLIIRLAFVAINISNIRVFNDLFHLSREINQKLSAHFNDFLYCSAAKNKVAFFEYFFSSEFFSEEISKEVRKQINSYLTLALDYGSHDVAMCIIDYDQDYDLLSFSERAVAFRRFIIEGYESVASIQCKQPWFNRILFEYCNQLSRGMQFLKISEIISGVYFLNAQDTPLSLMSSFGQVFTQSIFSNRPDITALFTDEANFTDLIQAEHLHDAFSHASRFHSIKTMEKVLELAKRLKFTIPYYIFHAVLKEQVDAGILERAEFICLQTSFKPTSDDLAGLTSYANYLGFQSIVVFLRNLVD
jgi:hypothetical protein